MLLFWQGGFLFYSAVVVPIGTDFLGSAVHQGFITQQVTLWLNRIGAISLMIFLWDAMSRDTVRWRKFVRISTLMACGVLLAVLHYGLHGLLSQQLDFEEQRIRVQHRFYARHWWYLMISTAHWLFMLAYAALTISAWRAEDRNANNS
jgi:hypothetical protein